MAAYGVLLGSSALILWVLALTVGGVWRGWAASRLERRRLGLELKVARREDFGSFARLTLVGAGRASRLPAYRAGDYLVVKGGGAKAVRRCYSLAAWQRRPSAYELVVKREPAGLLSTWIHEQLRPGVVLRTSWPRGAFHLERGLPGVYVLVAAGVGITPMRAMLHELLGQRRDIRIVLFWTSRHLAELQLYHGEFETLARRHARFSYRPRVTAPQEAWPGERGRLTAAEVLRAGGESSSVAGVWVCASHAMTQQLNADLVAAGLPAERFHAETFMAGPAADGREFPVEWLPTGQSLAYDSHPSLLHLLEAEGVAPDSECRSGSCGQCKVRLCYGEVDWTIRPEEALPHSVVLACCVRPAAPIGLAPL